ncbi:hypothetical protein LR48_Vigan07g177100 [Vigna angularis]|uniref:Putative plant transposon protein domain-containing protein n=1 Tax=Phaseolus angularis TaxID=3914 RepID=A0A0L9UZR4_PHAAN|nr:hypothetical protein LR48_Vigan07g177100 [Vigna angularis]
MTSSSGKRMNTLGSKRKDKEPDRSYSNKFLSRKHERHFNVVQDRRLLMERKAGLIPDFAPQFGEQLKNRNWGKLATYRTPANIAVVKEFYTNARRLGDHHVEDYLSYVRGHAIRYDPDSINRFVDTEWDDTRMQSIHRGQVATTEMIIGMYDTPLAHKWTMDEFHNVVAWPEEQAQGSRAGAAGASTMDDEDNDDEFEDAEDDGEEEDSDDNMG